MSHFSPVFNCVTANTALGTTRRTHCSAFLSNSPYRHHRQSNSVWAPMRAFTYLSHAENSNISNNQERMQSKVENDLVKSGAPCLLMSYWRLYVWSRTPGPQTQRTDECWENYKCYSQFLKKKNIKYLRIAWPLEYFEKNSQLIMKTKVIFSVTDPYISYSSSIRRSHISKVIFSRKKPLMGINNFNPALSARLSWSEMTLKCRF